MNKSVSSSLLFCPENDEVLLLLLPEPADDFVGPVIYSSLTSLVCRNIEAAGRPFEDSLLSQTKGDRKVPTSPLTTSPLTKDASKSKKDAQKGGKADFATSGASKKDKAKPKTKKLSEDETQSPHYEVLGLEGFEFSATDEQIKAAYKKMVVETHPDKTGGVDDGKFKAVQKAYEVLGDPAKRASYDSTLPFDDDIPGPTKIEDPVEFFEEFGPVFARNGRWSVSKNVPLLGDMSTSYKDVDRFYAFWGSFKSWRDFSFVDEHSVEDAECRDEKRWMERENERERSKLRRQENLRISTLTERAFKWDPRLRRRKDEEKALKEKKADDKIREKEQKELNEKKRLAEIERKAKEEIALQKNLEKQKLNDVKKCRDDLKRRIQPFVSNAGSTVLQEDKITKKDVEYIFGNLTDGPRVYQFRDAIDAVAAKNECPVNSVLNEKCRAGVMELLNERILFLERQSGFDRFGTSLKKLTDGVSPIVKKKEKDVWSEQELTDLTKAIAKYPGGCLNRWENVSDFIATKTVEQVIRKSKELTSQMNEGVAPVKPVELKQGDAKLHLEKNEEKQVTAEDLWEADQQSQLEEALKEMKSYTEKDKWDKIAEKVDGKTKKQCVDRYKFLANMFKK